MQLERDPPVPPCDDWAETIVQATAFAHVWASAGCRGDTSWSSHDRQRAVRAGRGRARRPALALAVGEVVQALFEAVLPC